MKGDGESDGPPPLTPPSTVRHLMRIALNTTTYSWGAGWAPLFNIHATQGGIPVGLTIHLSMQKQFFMGDGCLFMPQRLLFENTHQLCSKSMITILNRM